ncbi:MAG TPA: nucleotidyltransferase domain-containing protein [Candidatus Baltobacteraceae bacterium]|jgi:predicted nucleotidyltransferase|nr:nucleotidyltransferase domain-containing protein [Candidatus Baltobacteraceae bacterium]
MSANHGLTDATMAQIHEALSRFPEVDKAILYGSRAKGDYKPGSDVDLTLLGAGLTQKILGRIQDELEDGQLPYRFDLSILSQITHGDLIEHIRRGGVVFYEKKPVPAK